MLFQVRVTFFDLYLNCMITRLFTDACLFAVIVLEKSFLLYHKAFSKVFDTFVDEIFAYVM